MGYPRFIAEIEAPANRSKLWFGVWSGYALAVAFAALAITGQSMGLVPWTPIFLLLVGVKLATNTLALVSLRKDWRVLDCQGLNTTTDIAVMTAAIYYTGGQLSPLFPMYVIELTVIALLTNRGVTMLIGATIIAMYTVMSVCVATGVLVLVDPPVAFAGGLTARYVMVDLGLALLVIGVPTLFTARIVDLLGEKERALEIKTAALIEASQQKAQFMANVTHELRTPIHGICGLSDLVAAGVYGPVTEKQRNAQASIKRSATGLLRLVDDLLELSRADAGRLELRATQVEIGELVDAVIASAQWMLGTKVMTIDREVGAGAESLVTDRGKLSQILLNLVSNAVKFTPEGGRISIAVRPGDAGSMVFAVSDTGPGIAKEHQATIFEAFRQLDGTDERSYGGAGVGLSIVERMARMLGASVSVQSEVGAGATFVVEVPPLSLPPLPTAAGTQDPPPSES